MPTNVAIANNLVAVHARFIGNKMARLPGTGTRHPTAEGRSSPSAECKPLQAAGMQRSLADLTTPAPGKRPEGITVDPDQWLVRMPPIGMNASLFGDGDADTARIPLRSSVFLLGTSAFAQEVSITDCDKYAASGFDPQLNAAGVSFDKVNSDLAVPACEDAVRQYPNSTRFLFQLGRAYQKANNFTAALEQYHKAGEQGSTGAQNNLGLMYQSGQGVPTDDQQAAAWLRKAADQGIAEAQTNLGMMYSNGPGVPQDDQQALAWYRKAADRGLAVAQNSLGMMYSDGRGVPQDDAQAVAWFRKAADQGNADAQTSLGWSYQNGRGVSKDDAHAVAWYRKAADQGLAEAQYDLGWAYEKGLGVPQDDAQAVAWFRKAAGQGYAWAQYYLGWAHENGRGVPQDDQQALAWYRKAVEGVGIREAQEKVNELNALTNAKRDPDDVVAQVLNYTVFGNDDGFDDNYWFKDSYTKCQYRLHIDIKKLLADPTTDKFENMRLVLGMGSVPGQRRVIDLDELDPKNITFRYDITQTLLGLSGIATVIVQHVNEVLFSYVGSRLDINRVQRGWNLIYSKYCSGKSKPF